MKNVQALKKEYNHNLNRYYNGCNYLSEHPEDFDKYMSELIRIKENVENLLEQITANNVKVTQKEVLEGFSLWNK